MCFDEDQYRERENPATENVHLLCQLWSRSHMLCPDATMLFGIRHGGHCVAYARNRDDEPVNFRRYMTGPPGPVRLTSVLGQTMVERVCRKPVISACGLPLPLTVDVSISTICCWLISVGRLLVLLNESGTQTSMTPLYGQALVTPDASITRFMVPGRRNTWMLISAVRLDVAVCDATMLYDGSLNNDSFLN